ncbi:MAG: hypothetical protein ACNA7K_02515 [Acholeplasmataceae bacterium]
MKKWQYKTTMLFLLLTLILLIPTTVYAWVVYVEKKAFATFEMGDISITIQADGQPIMASVNLDDLAYVDFNNDFILDNTQTLDHMASSVRLSFVVDRQSIAVKNLITMTGENPGLLYIIVIEGINVAPGTPPFTAYHSIIESVTSGLLTKAEQLDAIEAYNAQMLQTIFETHLFAGDKLCIQFVFWGDYDVTQSLDNQFDLTLTIDTIQIRGELS